jgi:general secretion pathway protein G
MKIKFIRWPLVLVSGWFLILTAASIILPPIDSRKFSGITVQILAVTAVWLLLTVVTLAAYFYRSWRRVPLVSNKTTYVAWLSFETACLLVLVCGLVRLFVPSYVTSLRQARERILQQDLFMMRVTISQYTLDRHKRPLSLDDLVRAGYLKEVPTDPMTRRKDSWVVTCSGDRSFPGIVAIDSGYGNSSDKGTVCLF